MGDEGLSGTNAPNQLLEGMHMKSGDLGVKYLDRQGRMTEN